MKKCMKNLWTFLLAIGLVGMFLSPGVSAATIRNGNKGAAVVELQCNLGGIGFSCGKADGVCGTKTVIAIKNAQRYFGISSDGIAGNQTLSKIDSLVREIQSDLCSNGYNIKIDGYYGSGTRNAVIDFQKNHGLSADGQAGPQTRAALKQQSVSDGIYEVSTALDTGKCLDVSNVSQDDRANVQIYQYGGGNNQKLRITSLGGGYYSFVFVHSGKALDVSDASADSQANVQQFTWNDTSAQHWKIEPADDGYYYIINQTGGKYLDVCTGNQSNETNVWVYDGNQSNAQKWKLTAVSANSAGEYNADAAVAYARQHAYDNAEYYDNDCANFVSKCLDAGNVHIPDGSRISCAAQRSYLKDYYNTMTSFSSSDIHVGDILYMYNDLHHAVIVSGVDNNTIYYCAHTSNRRDYGLNISYFHYLIQISNPR